MRIKFTIFSLVTFVLSMVGVQAQTDSVKLIDEVVVTANYKATGIDKSINPVRILNIDKLQTVGVQNVGDALKFQGNFNIVQDNIAGTQTSVNGLSGNNIKVLVDGFPVIGKLNGNIDLSQLSLLNVERLEIVEGPLSAQYGTDALGGTINIITKKKFDRDFEALLTGYAESVGRFNAGAVANYKLNDNNQITINAGRNYFGGWSSVDTSRYQDWKPKIQYNAGARFSGNNGSGKNKNRFTYSIDANYFNEYLLNRGQPILPYRESAFDDHYNVDRWNTSFNATYIVNEKSKIDVQTGYEFYKRLKNSYYRDLVNLSESIVKTSGSQDTTRFYDNILRAIYTNSISNIFSFETGLDFRQETGTGLRIRTANNFIGDYALFASSEIKLPGIFHSLSIKPAFRVAFNTTYKIPFIPNVNLKWDFAPEWTARGSWGKGFRSPELKELYFYFVDINHNILGNPNLKPEDSQNFLASLHFKKVRTNSALKAELGGFYNDVNNFIKLKSIDSTSNAYSYTNVDHYQTKGGRLTGEITIKQLTFSAGVFLTNRVYSYTNNPTREATSLDANAQIYYKLKRLDMTFNVWFKHTDRFVSYDLDSKSKVQPSFIESYNLVDAGVSKKFFNNKIGATVGVKNILDVRNVTSKIVGTALSVHSSSDGGTSIATGRNFFVKFDIHL